MTHTLKSSSRYPLIDALRGSAIVMMVVFHFCFDLSLFKHVNFDFYHSPYWLNFRIIIVSLFTFIMGMSLHLAHKQGIHWQKYIKRTGILLGCALLITVTTYFTSGERFIYFGILHFIFVASIVAIPFLRLYWGNLILGSAILIFANRYENPLFHKPYLHWIGFMQYKPATDDYAPLLPWFGIVLLGMFFARWAVSENHFGYIQAWRPKFPLTRGLAFIGVYSLLIYMLHQPIFFGLFKLQQMLWR